ncbi:unnamed protein product [Amoebophrya sp. A120]|nr:unnamed protein product [Amoebophrya sp. A120]|eukprot:GSA120T00020462001.1
MTQSISLCRSTSTTSWAAAAVLLGTNPSVSVGTKMTHAAAGKNDRKLVDTKKSSTTNFYQQTQRKKTMTPKNGAALQKGGSSFLHKMGMKMNKPPTSSTTSAVDESDTTTPLRAGPSTANFLQKEQKEACPGTTPWVATDAPPTEDSTLAPSSNGSTGPGTTTNTQLTTSGSQVFTTLFDCGPENFVSPECFEHYNKEGDPTNGPVNYKLTEDMKKKLVQVIDDPVATSANKKILRTLVDDEWQGKSVRQSVRLTTVKPLPKKSIAFVDVLAMPAGLGTWPALWTNHGENHPGTTWPAGMEIDIMEHVNLEQEGLSTLHASPCKDRNDGKLNAEGVRTRPCTTSPECKLPWAGKQNPLPDKYTPWTRPGGKSFSRNTNDCNYGGRWGTVEEKNCPNAGCATGTAGIPMGEEFNKQNGGVYAMYFDDDIAAMWFWSREEIDSRFNGQITAELVEFVLQNEKPYIIFPINKCDVDVQYYIINTTLCGEFAGDNFVGGPGGKPLHPDDKDDGEFVIDKHQDAKAVRLANRGACNDYVLNNPESNKEWKQRNGGIMPHFDIRSFTAYDVTAASVTLESLQ